MKTVLFILVIFRISFTYCQQNDEISKKIDSITAEGLLLYKSEMTSWHGTDLFLEKYTERSNIGGYISYADTDNYSKCVFISKSEVPRVIGTITLDSTFNTSLAKIDLQERELTTYESDLFTIRNLVLNEFNSNSDGFLKFYQNTGPNVIPLIHNSQKKVYILTAPKESNVIIFGNDYLYTFDASNKLIEKKALHRNIIPIYTSSDGEKVTESIHSHTAETGDFITATDICTLMLYAKYLGWDSHHVVSPKYLNIWNCNTNTLTCLPIDMVKKISKDMKKEKKRKRINSNMSFLTPPKKSIQ